MNTLNRLFGQRKLSREREGGKATQRGRRRARAGFVAVLALLVLALPWGETQAQSTVIATIPVGTFPVGVGVNLTTNRIYVANSGSDTVSVIDGATNAVVTTIPVGDAPGGVGVNPITNRIYVSNEGSFPHSVSVIDGTAGSPTENTVVATIPVPGRSLTGARGIAVNPNTNRIYVPSFDPGGAVVLIDGATNGVSLIGVAANPIVAAVNPSTNRIYVGHGSFFFRSQITVIDGATSAVSNGPTVGLAQVGIGVDPDTNRIYVSKGDPSRGEPFAIVVVDGNTNAVLATIPAGTVAPVGVNPTTKRLYVNGGNNNISVIDIATGSPTENTVVATVGVGSAPFVVGVNTVTNRIYVSNTGSNTVSVIEDVVDTSPPVVNVSFPSPNGQNGWFVTSPVVGSVTADDTTTGGSNITAITCTGATVGTITGLGTPSASAPLTVSGEGVHNVSCTATDSAGNSGAATGSSNTATVMIDTVVPSVTLNSGADGCSLPGNADWCRGTQTAGFSASDATSGVASPCSGASCNFTQSATTNGSAVTLASGAVCDVAGNCNAGIDAGPYMIDSVVPSISIVSPANGGTYILNAAVASSYSCSDETSGVATCSGPVASGANFSTSPVGAHAFTVNATDIAGNPAQATNDYNVIYNFSGFFPPVDNPGPGPTFVFNVAKAGSAIPVKFSLSGNQGLNIFDTGFPVSQQITCGASSTQDAIEQTVTAGSSSLSYDATTDQYVYVWKTNKGWANTCRQLIVQLNDGTPHVAYFTFTK